MRICGKEQVSSGFLAANRHYLLERMWQKDMGLVVTNRMIYYE